MTRLYKSITTSMTKISLISFFSLLVSPITAQVIVTVTVSASAQPTSPSYATPTEFESQVLKFTNRYRADYNASAVTWNTTLAQFAQRWSQRCVFQHSGGPYGENLAAGYPNVSASIGAWADESQYYDFDIPTGFSEKTGHFTQLVWKSTTEVGCGVTNCPPTEDSGGDNDQENAAQGWYVVCEYYPPGNVVGDDNTWFEQNVDPPVNHGVRTVVASNMLGLMVMIAVLVVYISGSVF